MFMLSASPQCRSSSSLQCQQSATQPNAGLEVESANINKGLASSTTQTPTQTLQKNKKTFYLGKPIWWNGSVTDVEGKLGSTLAGRPTHEGTKQGINRASVATGDYSSNKVICVINNTGFMNVTQRTFNLRDAHILFFSCKQLLCLLHWADCFELLHLFTSPVWALYKC